MTKHAPISRVYSMGEPEVAVDPLEAWGRIESLRRRAWHKTGVIAVRPEELPDSLAGSMQDWAEQQYGRRGRAR